MASIHSSLLEKGVLCDVTAVAPSPSKDFAQIRATEKEMVFRLWKIKPPTRPDYKQNPIEVKDTLEDFLHDDSLHTEVERVFGKNTLEYMKALAAGSIDYLPRLPRDMLIHIVSYLDLEDILKLGATSKFFKEICSCNELWETIYRENSETPITEQLESLAEQEGWKKLFFTNKLQLQVQLRRQASKGRKRKSDVAIFMTHEDDDSDDEASRMSYKSAKD